MVDGPPAGGGSRGTQGRDGKSRLVAAGGGAIGVAVGARTYDRYSLSGFIMRLCARYTPDYPALWWEH